MDWFKNYISITVTIIALIGALFTFDARYAHADAVQKEVQQTKELVVQTTNNLRRANIEDKIFEIDVKAAQTKKVSPIDQAIKARYLRQLTEIEGGTKDAKISKTP